nr:hypothetical protein [Tanacetum cinerariifolium]
MKFLRSLRTEWNTHVVVWRNKADLDTMSSDDLYNNFKIVEQEVKRTVVSSSSSGSLNMAFLSSYDSTSEFDTAKDTSSKAIVAIDEASFDWSYMDDDEVPTNMALMAFLDSEVSDSDEDDYEEMVLKFDNVQHKPEQANQPRKVSQNPKNNGTNWNEMSTQRLGVGFQFHKKVCFMCGSFSHLIKDCDFHDKKMV